MKHIRITFSNGETYEISALKIGNNRGKVTSVIGDFDNLDIEDHSLDFAIVVSNYHSGS